MEISESKRIKDEKDKEGGFALITLKKRYYEICGWDEEGVPTKAKLHGLGLDDFTP